MSIAIVYHSGYGHTKKIAEAVAEGAGSAGAPPAAGLQRLNQATRCMAQWRFNGELSGWVPATTVADPSLDPEVAAALHDYLVQGSVLPAFYMFDRFFRRDQMGLGAASGTILLMTCAAIAVPYILGELKKQRHD